MRAVSAPCRGGVQSRWPWRRALAPRVERRRHDRCDRRHCAGAARRLRLLSANSRAACVVCSLGAAVTLVCLERRRRLGQETRCRVAMFTKTPSMERPAGGLACSRMPCVHWRELGRTLRARCAAVPPPRERAWSRRGDGGCSAGPTTVSAALGVGVASLRWAPRPTRRGCLAAWRARRRRHASRGEAEVAGFSARRRIWRL